jgi:hypothetical protein
MLNADLDEVLFDAEGKVIYIYINYRLLDWNQLK